MHMTGKQGFGLLMVGAAAGASMAMLFTPKSGAQMRKDIGRFGRRTMERMDDFQGQIREQSECVVENMNEAVHAVKHAYNDSRRRLHKMFA